MDTQNVYDDLDRLTRSDLKKQADASWTFSSFAYDPNSNLSDQEQNGLESSPGGSLVKAGRKLHSDYDGADWLATQLDFGTDCVPAIQPQLVNQTSPRTVQLLGEAMNEHGLAIWMACHSAG